MNWGIEYRRDLTAPWQPLFVGPAEEVFAELGRQVSGQFHEFLGIRQRQGNDWNRVFLFERTNTGYHATS